MNLKAWIAELVGTFGFVFVGVGAMLASTFPTGAIGPLGISLAHGLAIAVLATAVGAASGGHLNPALSAAAWLRNRIGFGDMIGYWIAQVAGAILAVRVLSLCTPGDMPESYGHGLPGFGPQVTLWHAFTFEAVLTFFLAMAFLGTALDKRGPKVGALFVGLAVTMGSLVGGPFTGGSMNPARFLGPAVAASGYENWVVYVVGPILGAAVAAILYQTLWADREEEAAAAA